MKHLIFTSILFMSILFGGCKNRNSENIEKSVENSTEATENVSDTKTTEQEEVKEEPVAEEPVFKITTSLGDIKIKLYKETPKHRDNFVKLAKSGFYNGILFHRIINGFMIQTGDPFTKDASKGDSFGMGGPGYTIPAEIVEGKTHKKGAIAAARKDNSVNPQRESSGSQFYIVQSVEGCKHLDGEYTIFGETIEGLDVIDKIAAVETNNKNFPIKPIAILLVKEVKE